MSLQVFLQAQLLGTEEFLATPFTGVQGGTADLFGRCAWLTLLCEVLPRALLAELKLSRMLLGSSSAEQFLLVLAEEDIPRADEFLARAAEAIAELSMNTLRLVWAHESGYLVTETEVEHGEYPALSEVAPAAFVEECEIYEQFGIRPATGKPLTDDELRLIAGYPRELALLFPGMT